MNKVRIVENKISFDFDGTLDDDFDGTPNLQKEEVQSVCKQLVEQGKDVCIITKRYGNPSYGECNKVYELAKQLGIQNVYFTDRELKHAKVF
jgi:hydroxymethylpyrimidine pyrophosphatase-like HAD family hydrolase